MGQVEIGKEFHCAMGVRDQALEKAKGTLVTPEEKGKLANASQILCRVLKGRKECPTNCPIGLYFRGQELHTKYPEFGGPTIH